jgi:hypothetical protein
MRFPLRRRWIAIAVLFAGPIVTVTGAPEWAHETAKDILAYPSAEKQIRELSEQRQVYQEEINHVIRRCAIKDSILDELEVGRISLLEAAGRFREMDRNSRVLSAVLYPQDRVGSVDEIAALTVISHMRTRLHTSQTFMAGTLDRLVCEFETAYGYRPE